MNRQPPRSAAPLLNAVPANDGAMSVTELNERIKGTIEPRFKAIAVRGELSGYRGRHGASRHMYFSLKDAGGVVSAVMWASSADRLSFTPEEGMAVVARGNIEVYRPRGQYQLVIQSMERQGVGDLQVAFRELCDRLRAEGLFEAARKKPIPAHPKRIGVITAPTGAVIRDMVTIIRRRDPRVSVLLYPVRVQGEGAKEEIAEAIEWMNARRRELGIDLLIVGRGGGSIEDLWAFNEESVIRAIARSALPIVSAVGHETDTTVADFVADLRAATPSEAAERVTPVLQELVAAVDYAAERLEIAARNVVYSHGEWLANCKQRLEAHSPRRRLRDESQRLDALADRFASASRRIVKERRVAADALAAQLEALSPLGVLARGYAIAQDGSGTVLRSPTGLREGDAVRVRLRDGSMETRFVRGVDG